MLKLKEKPENDHCQSQNAGYGCDHGGSCSVVLEVLAIL